VNMTPGMARSARTSGRWMVDARAARSTAGRDGV
jgi:hypothetical protein